MTITLENVRRVLRGDLSFVLLCPAYPRPGRSGGEFIRTRVESYAAAGVRGAVIEYSDSTHDPVLEETNAGIVLRVAPAAVDELVQTLALADYPVLAHSPSAAIQDLLRINIRGQRLKLWFHGYEVRDHRRLYCNYNEREAFGYALRLRPPQEGVQAAAHVFRDPDVVKIFVSDFQRRASEFDMGASAENSVVIPNHVDGDLFRARVRGPEEAKKILLMRSFRARNYGNDIALRALEHLSSRSGFLDLNIEVRGFGALFNSETAALSRLDNVTVAERYSTALEMAIAHFDHGVFLCPTRYDTQGVMLGEAMSSGMVCVTNRTAAIPEFADEECSLMVKPNDPLAFAEAIWSLVEGPEVMPSLSREAARRARAQCGYEATIGRELELMRGATQA